MFNNYNNPKGLLFGLLIGGSIGAIVALLINHKNGREFKNIEQKSREYFDEANDFWEEIKIIEGERLNELSSAKELQ